MALRYRPGGNLRDRLPRVFDLNAIWGTYYSVPPTFRGNECRGDRRRPERRGSIQLVLCSRIFRFSMSRITRFSARNGTGACAPSKTAPFLLLVIAVSLTFAWIFGLPSTRFCGQPCWPSCSRLMRDKRLLLAQSGSPPPPRDTSARKRTSMSAAVTSASDPKRQALVNARNSTPHVRARKELRSPTEQKDLIGHRKRSSLPIRDCGQHTGQGPSRPELGEPNIRCNKMRPPCFALQPRRPWKRAVPIGRILKAAAKTKGQTWPWLARLSPTHGKMHVVKLIGDLSGPERRGTG